MNTTVNKIMKMNHLTESEAKEWFAEKIKFMTATFESEEMGKCFIELKIETGLTLGEILKMIRG